MAPPSPPRQERGKKTLARVLAAAAEVFIEDGEQGFTVPAVSRRAGVSVGTVYRRFATRDDLLLAVMDDFREQGGSPFLAAWATTDWARMQPRDVVRELVEDLASVWRDRAPMMRALMARRLAVSADDRIFVHVFDVARTQSAAFGAALLHHRAAMVHAEPGPALDFGFRLTVSACGRWTAGAFETLAPEPMSWEEMLEHLGDVVAAYLFGPLDE